MTREEAASVPDGTRVVYVGPFSPGLQPGQVLVVEEPPSERLPGWVCCRELRGGLRMLDAECIEVAP